MVLLFLNLSLEEISIRVILRWSDVNIMSIKYLSKGKICVFVFVDTITFVIVSTKIHV